MLLDRVKKVSKVRGLSLKEVALKANIGENSIYAWKNREPSVAILEKVADVLNVSADYLMERTDDMSPVDSPNRTTDITDDTVLMAFDGQPIDDEDREKILEYARFVMSQKKGK